jgi:hypothetical protein
MSNYAQKIAESKQRSGEKALIYCLNQGLLAYYIVLAIQAKPDDDKFSVELLSEAEAHAFRL